MKSYCREGMENITVSSLISMAARGALWPVNWRMNEDRDKSQTMAVRSRDPETSIW